MWKLKALLFGIAAAAIATAAGCGSSGSGGSEPATALTKAELLQKGDEICAARVQEKNEAVKAALENISAPAEGAWSRQDLANLIEKVAPSVEGLVNELDKLPASSRDEAELEKIIAEMEAGLKEGESDPGSIMEDDPFTKASRSAAKFGLKACSF